MTAERANNLWLFLELLAHQKRLILLIVVPVTALAVVISLILPKWYTATAVLLPPKNVSTPEVSESNWSEVLSLTSGLNLPVRATPSDIYVRMLKSRSVTSRVMDRFDLTNRYNTSNFEETYLALMDHADLYVTEEGLLEIAVEDNDPQVAADIANAFVDELEMVSDNIVADRMGKTRTFLADRLIQVKAEVDSSRRELEKFQMKYKAVDFDEQTRLAIEQATALKVKLAEIEFDVRMGGLTLGKDNVELVRLDRRRKIIRNQLWQLENENVDSSFFSLPVALIPSLRGQYEVLYSRVQVAEVLYQVLLEQNEQMKVKVHESVPTMSVLDSATPPSVRSRPQRSLIVGLTFGLSIIFAVFIATAAEYLSRLRQSSPEDYSRLTAFVAAFFGWLPGVKPPRPPSRSSTRSHTIEEVNVDIDS